METYKQEEIFSFGIDEDSRQSMLETAKWTKFLAIMGFIFLGLMLLVGLFAMVGISAFSSMNDDMGNIAMGAGIGVFLGIVIFGLLFFFPTLYLYKYATMIKPAILSANQGMFNDAQRYLKRYFKFIGILTVVMLAFYLLSFVVQMILFAGR